MDKRFLWNLKKWNGVALVLLILIHAHFIVGHYYSDGSLRYGDLIELYEQWWVKLFSLLLNLSLMLHCITAGEAIVSLLVKKAKRAILFKAVVLPLSFILLILTSLPVILI